MGATCCRRDGEFEEAELNPMEMPEPYKSPEEIENIGIKKLLKGKHLEIKTYEKCVHEIVKIQSWFRGIRTRENYKTPKFQSISIAKYISQSIVSPVTAVWKREEELGPYVVYWSAQDLPKDLELRKPVVDEANCWYHGYWNKKTNKREGYGQQLFPNGAKYEGFWKDGEFEGEGRFIYETGDYYQGQWLKGKTNKQGTFCSCDGMKYIGEWRDSMHHGHGQETWEDGSFFEGNYVDGRKEGRGRFVWNDGSVYEGDLLDNKLSGYGVYSWSDGRIFLNFNMFCYIYQIIFYSTILNILIFNFLFIKFF